ncbi:hypothetical protein [Halioxenophilus aromaticivorans]|uniref:Uncharacterized protein n=1 Tax=Halioxenophilus aromaticivorans TaxID=1306992 RepID=A0AAV3U5H9_9ALTE
MELEAKEHRLVIRGLKKLLEETVDKMNEMHEDDGERVFLSNDAMLIDTMIIGFEEEYKTKYEK